MTLGVHPAARRHSVARLRVRCGQCSVWWHKSVHKPGPPVVSARAPHYLMRTSPQITRTLSSAQ